MNNGSMFASLTKYADQSYYDEHPEMLLVLPEQTYRVELFSGYATPGNSDTYQTLFADDAAFSDYLENVTAQSDFVSDVSVTSEDRIVTLSTCTYDYEERVMSPTEIDGNRVTVLLKHAGWEALCAAALFPDGHTGKMLPYFAVRLARVAGNGTGFLFCERNMGGVIGNGKI